MGAMEDEGFEKGGWERERGGRKDIRNIVEVIRGARTLKYEKRRFDDSINSGGSS
jgi:hypothetical protein